MSRPSIYLAASCCFGALFAGLRPKLRIPSNQLHYQQVPTYYGPIRPSLQKEKREQKERVAKCLKTMRKLHECGLDSVNLQTVVARTKYLLKNQDVQLTKDEEILVLDAATKLIHAAPLMPYLCMQEFQRNVMQGTHSVVHLLKNFKETRCL